MMFTSGMYIIFPPYRATKGGGDDKISIAREAIVALGKTNGLGAWWPA